jgi:hypothetical protein
MIHPVLHTLLADERTRELRAAADRYRQARSIPRPGRRLVRLRSPLVGLRGPTVVRLRSPLKIARAEAHAPCR